MGELIHLVVTQDSFDEHFSIDDWLNFSTLTNRETYDLMLNYVVDDKGQPVTVDAARKLFKGVKKAEWPSYVASFYKAVSDAFVPPANGSS